MVSMLRMGTQLRGGTIKELIHEEIGDSIMGAIDFTMNIQRQPDPKETETT